MAISNVCAMLGLCVLVISSFVAVETQGCVKCFDQEPELNDRCCRRFNLCCNYVPKLESDVNSQVDEKGTGSGGAPAGSPLARFGYCPPDRFPNANATICIKRPCNEDSECRFYQKCCPYGERKCCVFPNFIGNPDRQKQPQ